MAPKRNKQRTNPKRLDPGRPSVGATRYGRPLVVWCVFFLLGCMVACKKQPKPTQEYKDAIKAANEAYQKKDIQAELAALEKASATCIPRDCPETRYDYGDALVRAGQPEKATEVFLQLTKDYPNAEHSARAFVDLSKLAASKGDGSDRAYLLQAVKADPDSAAADRAVDILLRRARKQGVPEEARTAASKKLCGEAPECQAPTGALAAREEIDLLLATLDPKKEMTTYLLYQRAALNDELGREDEALLDDKKIVEAGKTYPQYDDACWRLAQRYLKKNQLQEAKAVLESFWETRHNSWAMGSLNSGYHDNSMLLLGEINEKLGQPKEAAKCYNEILKVFKQSILRDDALYHLMKLEALSKEERCDAIKKLQTEQQDSRYLKDSQALQKELGCP